MGAAVPGAIRRYVRRCLDDDLTGLAAELAFRFLLALFPFGVFVASVGALVAGHAGPGNPTDALARTLLGTLPGGLTGPIATQLHDLAMRARPDLLSIGAIGTIYAAGGGLNALMDAMNRAYEVRETRPLLARIAVAVILTVLAGTGVVVAFVALLSGTWIIQQVAGQLGLGAVASALLVLLRWPAMFALLSAAAALVFRLAPNVHTPWRWTLVGGVAFAVGWMAMTAAFAFYVGHASYGATYGPVAGSVVVMLWFYLTAIVLVAAAELVALLAIEREPELLRTRRAETAPESEARAAVDDGRRLVSDLERTATGGAGTRARRSDGG